MKKLSTMFVASILSVLFCTCALAGAVGVNLVVANSTVMSGSLGSATKNTTDNVQYIYCSDSGFDSITCEARNTANVRKRCSTSNPRHVSILRTVTDNTFLAIRHNNAGLCQTVSIQKGSLFAN